MLPAIVLRVQAAAAEAAAAVVADLQSRFPHTDQLLHAFGMLELPFWRASAQLLPAEVQQKVDVLFDALISKYGTGSSVLVRDGAGGFSAVDVPPLLDAPLLQQQRDALIHTMSALAAAPPTKEETTPQLWARMCHQNPMREQRLSEVLKVAKIAMVFPVGSVENERRFSLTNLVHSSLRNGLAPKHLNCCMRIAASEHTYKTFNVHGAHERWYKAADVRGRYMADQ